MALIGINQEGGGDHGKVLRKRNFAGIDCKEK